MSERPYKHFLGMQMTAQTWSNFRWDFIACVLFSFFNVVFNQFYVPIAIRNGASDLHVGLLTAAPAIGLLFSPVWAGLTESRSPKPFVVIPNLIGRALIIIPAFFTEAWVFVVIALCLQLLMGIQAPAYAAMMTKIYPADIRGRLMGHVRVAMGLIMIPLAFVVGQWIDSSGSRLPLITGAVMGVVSILAFSRIPVHQDDVESVAGGKKKSSLAEQLRLVRGNQALIFFLIATSLSGFGNMLATPLYNIIQVEHLLLSNLEIGYIRMGYFACLLLSYLLMGWLIDRYSPKAAMIIGICSSVLVPLLYGAIGTYPAVLTAGTIQGIADAAWDIGVLAFVFRIAPGREGIVFGLHLMLFGIRGTIGPLLSTTLIRTMPFEGILLAASALSLIGFIWIVRVKLAKGTLDHAQ